MAVISHQLTENGKSQSGAFRLRVTRTQALLSSKVMTATTVTERMVGLLGRSLLPEGEALFFPQCSSIHTVGMRFPIDVVFVDRNWQVVVLKPHLQPGRFVLPVPKAWGVVEMASGSLARVTIQVGDHLESYMVKI